MRSLDELLYDAKWGTLTKDEIEYIAQRLESARHKQEPDVYRLIHILGRSGAVQYRSLIESFMLDRRDPWISSMAFKALVHYLNLITEYTQEIKVYLKGVPWDNDDDLRTVAISAAGRYLSGYDDREMLAELIRIAESPDEDEIIRESVFDALHFASWRNPQPVVGISSEEYMKSYEEAKRRLVVLSRQ